MKLFSKRNKKQRPGEIFGRPNKDLVDIILRNRLIADIAHITSNDDFLEFFILFDNQEEEKKFLDKEKIDGFSLAELGYQISNNFDFENFGMIETIVERATVSGSNKIIKYLDDYILFDLIEILVLFSKEDQREIVIKRLNDIFKEEDSKFEIIDGIIISKTGDDIESMISSLEDPFIKKKLENYFYFSKMDSYLDMSKVSTEILNHILSNSIQSKKNQEVEKILNNVSKKIVLNKKTAELAKHLMGILKATNSLVNDIKEIRHTEKSAISISNGEENILYKMISFFNIGFIEFIIITLKEQYTFSEDWEGVKDNYINKYNINRGMRYIIKKDEPLYDDEDINVEDIPF